MSCPDENTLAELAAGTLPPAGLAEAERHLDACPSCRQVLAALLRLRVSQPGPPDALAATVADPTKAEVLPNGTLFDRYLVLERVGEGALGTVYAVFDPRLDRRVALKLLKTSAADASQRTRLLREAQAMARVSHPNVVTVFDAGNVGDRVFLTMELIAGVNLRLWQAGRPSPREVRQRFADAGEGLAAAHSAGLVHRDFKPDNVLVGRDGRVRVADFGLAAPQGPAAAGGALVGTPRYMAPEVLEGRPADARSDQFSYCLALAEALTGRHPLEGVPAEGLLPALREGWPRLGEKGPSRRERRVLHRGLSLDPAARFPSMDALLAELQPALSARPGLLAAAGALAAVALAVVPWGIHRASLCSGAAGRLAGVWDAPTREAARQRFLSSGASLAEPTFARAAPLLDAWSAGWVSMHTAACEATRLRGEQPEAVLEVRMQCLEQRWQALDALTHLWREADRDVVLAAAASVRALPAVESCADVSALANAAPLPTDPQVRAQALALAAAGARARSVLLAGRAKQAKAQLEPLVEQARATGYQALCAELMATLSEACTAISSLDEAEKAALDATDAAELSADARLVARTRLQLARVVAVRKMRREDSDRLFRSALVAIERAGNSPSLRAELEEVKAAFHLQVGLPAAAHEEYLRALEFRERASGPDDVGLAPALVGLARTAVFEKTLEPGWSGYIERALALQTRALGNEHPDIAQTLRIKGALQERFGDAQGALATIRQAIEMFERTEGDSVDLAIAQDAYGIVLVNSGRLEEARVCEEKALAMASRFLEPDHPSILFIRNNLIAVATTQSRWEDAFVLASTTLPRVEARLGRGNLKWAALFMNYCLAGVLAGHADLIAQDCFREHEAVAGLLPKNFVPSWHLVYARLLATQGRFDEAFAIFERIEREGDEREKMNARVLAAFARIQAGRNPPAAERFLRAEQERLGKLLPSDRQMAEQIGAFLAARPRR
ncbi:MAG: serine/threonine-protein kinase [Myxococcaceae bacterium]